MLSESSDSLKAKLAYASLREVACMNLLKEAYASLRALRDLLTQNLYVNACKDPFTQKKKLLM